MGLPRKFKSAHNDHALNLSVTLGEAVPPNPVARFVVDVINQLDLSAIYARYAPYGGEAFAPDALPRLPVWYADMLRDLAVCRRAALG